MINPDFNYIFHTDPGHGWLEVPKAELKYLGIEDKISSCSYVKGDKVYLEEDCDAWEFISVFKHLYGTLPNMIDSYTHDTPIRRYKRYEV